MSRTTKFSVSLWLAIPLVAVAGELAMAANHAPVLNASKSPVLAPECQNAGAPSGAVGTLVSSLVDFAVPAGQVDNVTDSDAGAKLGIAVTAANTTNGSWWYSKNNGTNWYALGAVTDKKCAAAGGGCQHAHLLQTQHQLLRHAGQRHHLPRLGPDQRHQRRFGQHHQQRRHDCVQHRHRHRQPDGPRSRGEVSHLAYLDRRPG